MHPDLDHDKLMLQSKDDSHIFSWKAFTKGARVLNKFFKNIVTSSDKSETKQLSVVEIYLTPYCNFITGKASFNKNPLEAIYEIVYIIESLIKDHFFVESNYCHSVSSDAKKV